MTRKSRALDVPALFLLVLHVAISFIGQPTCYAEVPRTALRELAPPLDGESHKGQSGRIGIYGGSRDYTGAPYFAAMSALRAGAELVHVYTSKDGLVPIKSYSPELMVSDVSSVRHDFRRGKHRLHAVCAGPGLGQRIKDGRVARDLQALVEQDMPVVLDADAVRWAATDPAAIEGRKNVVLTPNAPEFAMPAPYFARFRVSRLKRHWTIVLDRGSLSGCLQSVAARLQPRLVKAVLGETMLDDSTLIKTCCALSGPTVILKGRSDRIYSAALSEPVVVEAEGSRKRPGGIGDILAGCTALLASWAWRRGNDALLAEACEAASTLVRRASCRADKLFGRALTASDILPEIAGAFIELESCAGDRETSV